MFERVHAMLVKEFLELRRDRWAMFRLVVPLAIQVLVYGYAATFTVNHVPTAVLDLDHSAASRELVSHLVATGRFDVIDAAHSQRELGRAVALELLHKGAAEIIERTRVAE